MPSHYYILLFISIIFYSFNSANYCISEASFYSGLYEEIQSNITYNGQPIYQQVDNSHTSYLLFLDDITGYGCKDSPLPYCWCISGSRFNPLEGWFPSCMVYLPVQSNSTIPFSDDWIYGHSTITINISPGHCPTPPSPWCIYDTIYSYDGTYTALEPNVAHNGRPVYQNVARWDDYFLYLGTKTEDCDDSSTEYCWCWALYNPVASVESLTNKCVYYLSVPSNSSEPVSGDWIYFGLEYNRTESINIRAGSCTTPSPIPFPQKSNEAVYCFDGQALLYEVLNSEYNGMAYYATKTRLYYGYTLYLERSLSNTRCGESEYCWCIGLDPYRSGDCYYYLPVSGDSIPPTDTTHVWLQSDDGTEYTSIVDVISEKQCYNTFGADTSLSIYLLYTLLMILAVFIILIVFVFICVKKNGENIKKYAQKWEIVSNNKYFAVIFQLFIFFGSLFTSIILAEQSLPITSADKAVLMLLLSVCNLILWPLRSIYQSRYIKETIATNNVMVQYISSVSTFTDEMFDIMVACLLLTGFNLDVFTEKTSENGETVYEATQIFAQLIIAYSFIGTGVELYQLVTQVFCVNVCMNTINMIIEGIVIVTTSGIMIGGSSYALLMMDERDNLAPVESTRPVFIATVAVGLILLFLILIVPCCLCAGMHLKILEVIKRRRNKYEKANESIN